MNYLQLAPLLAVVCNLPLAIFALWRDARSRINQVFFLWGLSLSVWNLGAFMMFRVSSPEAAFHWARFLHFGVIFIPIAMIHLSLLISEIKVGKWIIAPYVLAFALAVSNCTDFYITGVRYVGYAYFSIAGPGFWIYSSIFPLLSVPPIFVLIHRRAQLERLQRRKFTTLIWANALLLVFGTNDILPVLKIDHYPFTHLHIYPWGTLMAFVYGVLVAYSVLQDQLLDIRVTLGRLAATVVRLLFFFLFGFFLLLLIALIAPHEISTFAFTSALVVLLLSALMTSIFFPKLLGPGAESLERRILGDRFEYQEQMRGFIGSIHSYQQAGALLADLESLLLQTVRVRSYQIAFLDLRANQLTTLRAFPRDLGPEQEITPHSPVLAYFGATRQAFLDLRATGQFPGVSQLELAARRQLQPLTPELCFPLYSNEQPFGFLLLGKKSGEVPFTAFDLDLLGNLVKSLSLSLDQIRLKNQVALTEQLEVLADMSRGLAHDLNNLATPIHTYLQLDRDRHPAGSPAADLFDAAMRNLGTIRSYVREAVFFSNHLEPGFAPLSLDKLLVSTAQICQHQLEKKGVTLVRELAADLVFSADEILLQRMLSNLIFNACDASPPGAGITLRAGPLPRLPDRPAWLRLQVIDRGCGIPKENLERVFAPYFTTKNTGDQTRGFGLGLTICQKIVHLHHGTLSLQSVEGAGATLQADLPVVQPPAPPAPTRPPP